MRLRPFRALRPAPALASRVVAPPYDVVSRAEAARLAAGNPLSFLHVGRSDIDLPDEVDPHDPRVYATARDNLARLVADGVLVRESEPRLYVYREALADRSQVGVVGCVHVGDYASGVIKRHERTTPDKEDDRTRHILALAAHAEPVLMAYRGRPDVERLVAAATAAAPLYDLTTADGVRHTVWRAPDATALVAAFAAVPAAYVADGHHRSAGAWRAARERGGAGDGGGAEHDWFPAALCPAESLRILPYNRLVRDLGGRAPSEVLEALARVGRLSPSERGEPPGPGSVAVYVGGRWHLLELPPDPGAGADAVRALDVWRLDALVLGPVLGIGDQRTDPRIAFVGGSRGPAALAARVDAGEAALAVSMFPMAMGQLMAVADAGGVMPPKSTWFEPKLLSGLFVHPLD